MDNFRFRFTKDFDVEAGSLEEAEEKLRVACRDVESISLNAALACEDLAYLGLAAVQDIDASSRDLASPLLEGKTGLILMSCQYRGENFTSICRISEIDSRRVRVKPLALVLNESKLEHVMDHEGTTPQELSIEVE